MIQELSYVGIASPNHDAWRDYGTQLLGCKLADDGSDSAVRLAVDDVNYRIAIHPSERDEFRYAGWAVANETDLHRFTDHLRQHGIEVNQGDEQLLKERQVADLVWFEDPFGIRHELSWGKLATPYSFRTGRAMMGRFVTGDQGLGHVVFLVPDLSKANEFYVDVLGFRLSDRILNDRFNLRFYHVNGRRGCPEFRGTSGAAGDLYAASLLS